MKSKNNQILIIAYNKGYRVDKQGNVYFKGKKRSLILDTKGYNTFTIRCNLGDKDIFRRVWVHKLQAYQKYGNILFNHNIEVRHKNNDKSDNSFKNILIGSHKENMNDVDKNIRLDRALHAASYNQKYNYQNVYNYYLKTRSYKQTQKKFNISSKGTLNYIITKCKKKVPLAELAKST